MTGNGRAERRGNSTFGSVWSVRSFHPSTSPASPRSSAAAGIRRNTRSPSRQSPPPSGTVSAGPFAVQVAVPNVPEQAPRPRGRPSRLPRGTVRPAPRESAARIAATTGTPAPAEQCRARERHLDERAARLGDQQGLEHLRHRVALAADLEQDHVVRPSAGPGDLDLRPRGPARRRAHGGERRTARGRRGRRLVVRHQPDRLRDERLTLDHPALPREDRAVDHAAVEGPSRSALSAPANPRCCWITHWGSRASRRTESWAGPGTAPVAPTPRLRASPAIVDPTRHDRDAQAHRAVIVWSALAGIKGKEKRPRGSPPWGVVLPVRC